MGVSEVDEAQGGAGIPRASLTDALESRLKKYSHSQAWEIKKKLHEARGSILRRRRRAELREMRTQ